MIEGLVEISRESIIIRELCFMVKHMRKSTLYAILSSDFECINMIDENNLVDTS